MNYQDWLQQVDLALRAQGATYGTNQIDPNHLDYYFRHLTSPVIYARTLPHPMRVPVQVPIAPPVPRVNVVQAFSKSATLPIWLQISIGMVVASAVITVGWFIVGAVFLNDPSKDVPLCSISDSLICRIASDNSNYGVGMTISQVRSANGEPDKIKQTGRNRVVLTYLEKDSAGRLQGTINATFVDEKLAFAIGIRTKKPED